MDEGIARGLSCCFTGHRPNRLPWGFDERSPLCLDLRARIKEQLKNAYEDGFRRFYCGMALGADMIFCEQALAMRENSPGVEVFAVVPFAGQSWEWGDALRLRHVRLCTECDRIIVLRQDYSQTCMLERNQYMVDRSARLIAVYDGEPYGGTMQTILMAKRAELTVIILEP